MTNQQIETAILELIDLKDEVTYSDLQGMVQALVLKIKRGEIK